MRRRFIGLCACLLALAAGTAAGADRPDPPTEPHPGPSGRDWPGFLGPNGDGKSPETGLFLNWTEDGPPLVWHWPIGEGFSMPSVAGGRLFLFDRIEDRTRLTCLDAGSGEKLWQSDYAMHYDDTYQFSNGPRASPVIDAERVYTFGVEGRLRCHRVVDGKLLWDVDTTERFGVVQNFFGVGSTPLIEGDLLIVPVGGSPPDSPAIHSGEVRGNGSGIVAFDKLTGKLRYRVSDEQASYSSPVVTTVGDRRWGFVFARGGLIGFEPGSGKVDFHYPWRSKKLESVNAANPVVVGDRVLITEAYGKGSAYLQVRPGGYEVVRTDPPRHGQSMASHWMTPIHHEGHVYGVSGQSSGEAELRCVELETGKIKWSHGGLGRSTLLLADGHLIALTERGTLLVIRASPERYELVAESTPRFRYEGELRPLLVYPAWNAPVLSHGLLYVRGKNRLACLDLNPRPAGGS